VILGAALLVLVALGLFVAGIATGGTAFYWGCVAVSVLAAVLLVVARRRMGRHRPAADGDGRVSSPDQGEPVGRLTEATAPGLAEERSGDQVEPLPAALVPADDGGEPPVEEVEVSDLLLVVDVRDEVLVVDEHPRYHLADCPWLAGRTTTALPLDEARTDGFTPCGRCAPDRHHAAVERARRAEGRST
jgi:hypothetical protein